MYVYECLGGGGVFIIKINNDMLIRFYVLRDVIFVYQITIKACIKRR